MHQYWLKWEEISDEEFFFLNGIVFFLTSSSSATIPLRSSSDKGPSSSADKEFSFQLVSEVGKVCVKSAYKGEEGCQRWHSGQIENQKLKIC